MGPELLAYPFLFIAIFFESFILVNLLSKPARQARRRSLAEISELPTVGIIVPCYNEAATVAATCESLLALTYPQEKLEVILVDDGSKDETPSAMAQFRNNPRVKIIRKENGGKHTALNAGIAATTAEIVGCLDADSFVEPDALSEMIPCFVEPIVAAATAAMSVHKPENMLQHMQHAEYNFGITLRHALASVNGLYVTPGPFSLYRREIVRALGNFRHGHQTEDLEMALRLQSNGYRIENAPRARVYTKTPKTIPVLLRQRTRWTTGFLRNILNEYRHLMGNRLHGALGMLVIPLACLGIASSILAFGLAVFQGTTHALAAAEVRSGIPLSYALMPHGTFFDWFYFPSELYLVLAACTVLFSLSFIAFGKKMSRTPGSLASGLFSYLVLYGFIAPLWLIRSVADVTLNKKRTWR
ncbi:MAG TPA: glycosyltransferase family 2 protein [Candidatus Paceibacterota bacterium]|nr:glycosyltransferase family 2 protein [Candidatus Paceibacterota bacterium]